MRRFENRNGCLPNRVLKTVAKKSEPLFIYEGLYIVEHQKMSRQKRRNQAHFATPKRSTTYGLKKRKRSALVTTETELSAMAPPASIGLRAGPPNA